MYVWRMVTIAIDTSLALFLFLVLLDSHLPVMISDRQSGQLEEWLEANH